MIKSWNDMCFDVAWSEDNRWIIQQVDPETRKRIRLVGYADPSIVNGDEIIVTVEVVDPPTIQEHWTNAKGQKTYSPPWTLRSMMNLASQLVVYSPEFYEDLRGKKFRRLVYQTKDGTVIQEYNDRVFK